MTALAPLYIKKAYNQDPFFKTQKCVLIFDDEFKKPFRPSFAENLRLEGIEDEDVQKIKGKELDFAALTRFAIDFRWSHSIEQNINSEVLKYIGEKNINFLEFRILRIMPMIMSDSMTA
jgi:starch synthase